MVITAHLFHKIFTIIDPASLYLQSEKIEILTAIRLVETGQSQLVTFRGQFESVLKEAKEFCEAQELEDRDFEERRLRKKKKMPGEVCSDEKEKEEREKREGKRRKERKRKKGKKRKTTKLEENTHSRYRRETFIFAIDTAVSSIKNPLEHIKKSWLILQCWIRRDLQT